MIVFLLLVIIAILLFGSSAVVGCIGWGLGAIVAIVAIVYAMDFWNSLSGMAQLLVVASPLIAIAAILVLALVADFVRSKAWWL